MVATIKFSQFAAGNLANTTNQLVGITSNMAGTNFKTPFPFVWTTATRPSSPALGTQGYNSSLGQIEFWNGASWTQLAAGGSGSINLGSINQLAYYATTGTAISGLMIANNSVLITNGSGVPSLSTSLPTSLTVPQPNIVGVTNGSNASAGSVGQFISNVVNSGSPVLISAATATDITSISLTAGDWDVYGNVTVIFTGGTGAGGITYAWSNIASVTIPDPSLINGILTSINSQMGQSIPYARYNISTTTTVYLSVYNSGGTANGSGGIYARRIR